MKDTSSVRFIDILVINIKAERKRAAAKETLLNKFVAWVRQSVKMDKKVAIKGYGCPKVRIIHSHGVETPRNKEQVAKRQRPTLTKMVEYPAQEVICHVRDSNSHVFRSKKVTELKPTI